MEQGDLELLVNFTIQNLEPQFFKPLSNEYYYQSLTLAAIDAVFSAQARYPSVQAVVERYCQRYNRDIYRKQRESLPSIDSQEHISSLVQKIEQEGIPYFVDSIFSNKSQTSGRLKVAILLDLLRAIRDCNIQTFQDIQPILSNIKKQDELLERFMEIHGIGEATSRYFLMLAGDDRMVKPDTMILRFVENALGKTVRQIEAVHLIQATSDRLLEPYPDMSPRRLDHLIWSWQRSQANPKKIHRPTCKVKASDIQEAAISSNKFLTVPEKTQESMYRRYKPGALLSGSQIKDNVITDYPDISRGSVIPPDYCSNKSNKDPRSGIYKIFFYDEIEGKYRLL